MALIRPGLEEGLVTSGDLAGLANGTFVRVPGMVVARQRPATANGVVFMLLEDEVGTVNIVVPPPVYVRDRLAVRTASFARVDGRLEHRDGVMNVVARSIHPLATPDQPATKVRHIEPPTERETGRRGRDARHRGGSAGGGARSGRSRRTQLRAPGPMNRLFKRLSDAPSRSPATSLAEHMFRPRPFVDCRPCSTGATTLASESSTVSTS